MAFAAELAPIVGALGTAVSAAGTIAGANAQSAALNYQARVARIKATQEEATAQRSALETKRRGDLVQSTLQARAAASGAGASDPTVVDLAGDIGARSRYQSGLQMWQGQMKSWDYNVDANAKEAQADAYKTYGNLSAFGTLLGGAGSLFKAYGGSGPKSSTAPGEPDDYLLPHWANY